ncbi:hypothetical protein [Nocardia otitidiscaviarum]|uniref:hypothetical protein n=1 Tax=Nocardia otitidiscaviarum TaxID=1823 RepID=UPI0002F613CD|nr:hypothetical protein [Nocardia otitidiscaviarum]
MRPTESARIIREQKRKIAEQEQTIETLSAAMSFARGQLSRLTYAPQVAAIIIDRRHPVDR